MFEPMKIVNKSPLDKLWFTSDLHFGHRNMAKWRGYANTDQMDLCLTRNWNAVIKPDDTVYVLGDFSFYNAVITEELLTTLNGTKNLIVGNHDSAIERCENWAGVTDYVELMIPGKMLVLSHYPLYSWNGRSKGAIHLHGHLHGLPYECEEGGKKIDVGVDVRARAVSGVECAT